MIPAWITAALGSVTARVAAVGAALAGAVGLVVMERKAGAQSQVNRDLQAVVNDSKAAAKTDEAVDRLSNKEVHDALNAEFGRSP